MDYEELLKRLAANRQRRLSAPRRARFRLTEDELQRSAATAMRLADAAPPQAELDKLKDR